MMGCGKINEIEMLKYLEGSLSKEKTSLIDLHLMECMDCLEEIVELGRINSTMDAAKPEGFKLPDFISVFLKKGLISSFDSSFGSVKLSPVPMTRDKTQPDTGREEILLEDKDLKIKINPVQEGIFWLTIQGDHLKGKTIVLKRSGEDTPVYLRKAENTEIMIKGLNDGKYQLDCGDRILYLFIQ